MNISSKCQFSVFSISNNRYRIGLNEVDGSTLFCSVLFTTSQARHRKHTFKLPSETESSRVGTRFWKSLINVILD